MINEPSAASLAADEAFGRESLAASMAEREQLAAQGLKLDAAGPPANSPTVGNDPTVGPSPQPGPGAPNVADPHDNAQAYE